MRLKAIVFSALSLTSFPVHGETEGPISDACVMSKDGMSHPRSGEIQEDEKKVTPTHEWVHVSGDIGFLSDYVSRGETQTFGGPAVQAEVIFSQKKDEGVYAGIFGSNIDSTTATNGAGLEFDLYGGYAYKANEDLSLKLEIRNSRYPGAYAPLPTKDSYDTLEVIPSITYKYFTIFWAYQISNVSGVNQNFAPTFFVPLSPNGNSKGSWYVEADLTVPIPGTEDKLNFNLNAGYWHIHNYSARSYAVFGGGLSYTLPDRFSGLVLFVNACASSAQRKYYTSINLSGQSKNTMAPKVWVGVLKNF